MSQVSGAGRRDAQGAAADGRAKKEKSTSTTPSMLSRLMTWKSIV